LSLLQKVKFEKIVLIRRHGSVSGVKYIERYTTREKLPCIFTRAGEMQTPEIFVSKKRLNRSNSK